ncbi:hypothetical protein MUK42_16079 [Musa troglodytarum]|uniref:Uncharacterized protein n=1 Tax=Musa troglodytarum TaxID=320322 RepID=A0A9E7HEW1_9LILI|nr:hypothetical protein MUK42_16079 [Musa troglodytarum]
MDVCEPNWRICRALLEFAAAEGRDASLLWSRRVSSSTDGGGKDRRRPPALLTTCRRPPQDRCFSNHDWYEQLQIGKCKDTQHYQTHLV